MITMRRTALLAALALLAASPALATVVGGPVDEGQTASGSPILMGCRVSTAARTGLADGKIVMMMCSPEGKQVIKPYAVKELDIRGSASSTDTAAHQLIASAGAGQKNYVTGFQCTNSSTTDSDVTLNDSGSFSATVPHGSGFGFTFATPLVTAAATALNFTMGTGVTTVKCNFQGYTGP